MQSVFTSSATSRFIDREAVVAALQGCAQQLKAEHEEVVAVHLFGSFATRTATPRSDADIVVELAGSEAALQPQVWDAATTIFLQAPVPVDLFVLPSLRLAENRGVASALSQQGIRLA
ncbi:MAG: nucleotidyltransferase domain-containing protein [Acidobacteriota bacterium]